MFKKLLGIFRKAGFGKNTNSHLDAVLEEDVELINKDDSIWNIFSKYFNKKGR